MMTKFGILEKLDEQLYVLEEMKSNVYFIGGSEKILILDTAYGMSDLKGIARRLFGDKPMLVVNSHEHMDHNSGNNQFDVVHVGRYGEPGSHVEIDAKEKQRIRDFLDDKVDGFPFVYDEWLPGPCAHMEPVEEGFVFDLGDLKLTVIETPGHCSGEIALYEADKRWIFTGDSALAWEVWGQLADSMPLRYYAQSLRKLASYEDKVDVVFPAHSVAGAEGELDRFKLPPRILSMYAEGTEKIVSGEVEGKLYHAMNDRFLGCRYVLFEIGGMAYDPNRI